MPIGPYLGALGSGLGPGENQGYDQSLKQASDIAFGRTLQMLGQGQQQQGPIPGIGPPGGIPQQPPMGGMPPQGQPPQMGGSPPMPQGSPPMRPPQQGGPIGSPSPQPPIGGPIGQPGNPGAGPGMMPPQGGQQQLPQPQGWGQQGGQGGGPLDWRQVFQAVQRANPGAPPQVIAGAVEKAIPLMNSQSQQEWKQVQMQFREQALQMAQERLAMQQQLGQGRLEQGQQRLNQGDERLRQGEERLDITREAYGQAPKGGGQQFSQDFDKPGGMGGQQGQKPQGAAAAIADQIVSGKAPPVTTGMYRLSGPVRADLAKSHPEFNLAQAQLEWKKAERMVQGLTSPQQMRFQQLGTSVVNTMDMAMQQAKELQLSGITPLNRAKLEALVNLRGNSPIGQQAAKYLQTVAFLKGEVANLENGGYAPTESSWAQARNVINENYGVDEFLATIPNAQRLINYRLSAQQQVPQGMSQGSRYQVPQGTEAPDQQGIPQGWSVKEH